MPVEANTDEARAMAGPPDAWQGHSSWQARRDVLRDQLRRQPLAGLTADEVEAHFAAMPPHYWERVDAGDLAWSLETIHGFFELLATPDAPPTRPFLSWRKQSPADRLRLMLCTWDRQGLLAKAAAVFSAVRLNILAAEVFTRSDHVVLDTFAVTDAGSAILDGPERMREMTFLLEGALSEPPRFASVWACSRHKLLAQPGRHPVRIDFDNQSCPNATVIRVEASDRLGLLYDLLQTLAEKGLHVTHAAVATDQDLAHDLIQVQDARGQKVLDPGVLESLRGELHSALAIERGS